ncbi:DUF58 domain-containing protein [Halorubrum ezzemoulense]|uniref:DUF58 domain-containing protein n=1 Tax=Halorubrum ezzemoulense TaxID=337243 RepID=UPI00232FA54F|nr:DUF58 domain-containing protein [Halorubrum ezzemoulense]MDB2261903.1 DUF58 domain-containing protein [Halorubrum ezzemoulense]MDB2268786.1 DUF58 domain-containing protein [Halorubrum ezzemoulense]
MTPALTRRGRVAGVVGLVAAASAFAAGGRALDAIVIPVAIALAAGYVQVLRVDVPAVRHVAPADGFVGETREVRLEFGPDAVGGGDASPSFLADVSVRVDEGLDGPTAPIRASVGTEPVSYRVTYRERGERTLGPIDLTVTDVFGLFERELVVDETDAVTVYPPRDPMPTRFRRALYAADAVDVSRQREEFDRLREYTRGDAVRDVHWATTAKRDEIVVKEFAAETARNRVTIAGGTDVSSGKERPVFAGIDHGDTDRAASAVAADELARATVSLALALLDDGVPVDVRLPGGRVSAAPGGRGRREVLELAAVTGPGAVADDEADVTVVAGADGARFRTGDRAVSFADLRREAEEEGTPTGAHGPRRAESAADPGEVASP